MTPKLLYQSAVLPALSILPTRMDSTAARIMLMAIAGQESGMKARFQDNNGPARGFWQCEIAGIEGIWQQQQEIVHAVVDALNLSVLATTSDNIHFGIAWNDVLAATMARLILWCDPKPLPAIGDQSAAWDCYLRNWRPGKPRPESWSTWYGLARDGVIGGFK